MAKLTFIPSKFTAIVAALVSALTIQAQDNTSASSQSINQRLDSLQNRIEQLETTSNSWKKYVEYLPTISGFIQTGYNYNSFGDGTSTFQMKRLRLIVSGDVKRFQYKIQLEGFYGVNIGSRWEKQRLIQILDAYGQYNFNNWLQLRVGQFSSPAGYENYLVSPSNNVTIDYASICSRMVLRNAVGYDYTDCGRDIGLMLMGNMLPYGENSHFLQYNLALTNGHLISVNDNNKSKDIIAALTFWPRPLWNIKLSYNWGEYTPDSFSGNLDNESYPWNTVKGSKYVPMHRVIVGTWYNNPNGWDVRAEFAHMSSSVDNVRLVNEYGGYLLAAYHFKKWIPVARFDFYRDNINKTLAENRYRGLLGCTFVANKHIKVQLNYLLSRYTRLAADTSNKGRLFSNELLLMGFFSF